MSTLYQFIASRKARLDEDQSSAKHEDQSAISSVNKKILIDKTIVQKLEIY